jgi:putative chitinase
MGNTEPGDGWKFRGRGLIQLTGKNNYTEFKDFMDFNSLEETIEYLETPEGAIESAAWFWYQRDCSIPADKDDGVTVTEKINGGTNHLKERLEYTAWFKKIVPPGNYTIETTEDGSST